MKTGIEKYEVWLDKGNEVLNLRKEGDDRLWVSKDEALAKARELLAEEKAVDEGLRQYLKREIHLLKTQSIEGPFQDGMKYAYENILSRHPAPSRTEELVKRLRDACDHMSVRNEYGVPCMTVGTVTEILSDFEKGAK